MEGLVRPILPRTALEQISHYQTRDHLGGNRPRLQVTRSYCMVLGKSQICLCEVAKRNPERITGKSQSHPVKYFYQGRGKKKKKEPPKDNKNWCCGKSLEKRLELWAAELFREMVCCVLALEKKTQAPNPKYECINGTWFTIIFILKGSAHVPWQSLVPSFPGIIKGELNETMWQQIISDIPGLGNFFVLPGLENISPKIHLMHHPHEKYDCCTP